MTQVRIGIIGGSGLYRMEALKDVEEVRVETAFGTPSDALIVGKLDGVPVAFLARHGRRHHLLPTEVPYRANILAMKQLGVEYILSPSAVGSLQAEIAPLDMVIPDQFIDRTFARPSTFFGSGLVGHVTFGDPFCAALSQLLAEAVQQAEIPEVKLHQGGTYVCMEGPAFSTKAESQLYRSWGAQIIGMTNLTEAKLAREAEIAYATLAMVTDYDCWHPDHDSVTVEMVIANLHKNATNAQKIVRAAVGLISDRWPKSAAHEALRYALLTQPEHVPAETRQRLAPLLAKYWG